MDPRELPAFPCEDRGDGWSDAGMTLRDYFAIKALPQAWSAELSDLRHFNADVDDRHVSEVQVSKRAYRIADAMLAERQAA